MNEIILRTPAKVNLSLDITGKRADGYHTLRSVFQAVDCYDTLKITHTEASAPLALTCSEAGIPCDEHNLVYKAAVMLLGEQPCGISMHLEKQIPSQAGMGGGSSDCAAALLGIRKLLNLDVSDAKLLEIAVKLGADVPFFLCGGTAVAEGIGEQLTPLADVPERTLVLAKGNEGVSTPEGYRKLDLLEDSLPMYTDAVLEKLRDPQPQRLFTVCGNAFDAVTKLREIKRIRLVMSSCGINPVLSGSGAAVFGGCEMQSQAEHLAKLLAGMSFVRICKTVPHGVQMQTSDGAWENLSVNIKE